MTKFYRYFTDSTANIGKIILPYFFLCILCKTFLLVK